MMDKKWASIVLSAGRGTRMKSDLPKVMHQLLGKPLIGHVLDIIGTLNTEINIVVTGHGSSIVEKYLDSHGKVVKVRQEEQLGTGHAVRCADSELRSFSGDVLILCGDTPLLTSESLLHFMHEHEASGADLSVLTAEFQDAAGYGRIVRGGPSWLELREIVEEKDASDEVKGIREVNTGIYAGDSKIILKCLEEIGCDNAQGEYYLTDTVRIAREKGYRVHAFKGVTEQEAHGINSRRDLAAAEKILLERIRRKWMDEGVTFIMPELTYIETGVRISRDAVIGPHVVLKGKTTIGQRAGIGAFSYLENAEIRDEVMLPPFSRIER